MKIDRHFPDPPHVITYQGFTFNLGKKLGEVTNVTVNKFDLGRICQMLRGYRRTIWKATRSEGHIFRICHKIKGSE